jgi:hypothetical protein
MGKKSKRSGKKALKTFVKGNKVLLAAIGGTAAGITIAKVLGMEKAQQLVRAVENSFASIEEKVKNGFRHGTAEDVSSNPSANQG